MSAEILRRAAALMRQNAEAVPASPWFTIDIPVGRPAGEREWIVDSETRLIAGNVGIATDPTAEPLAEHIAAWHPAVALAVAEWLDDVAETWELFNSGELPTHAWSILWDTSKHKALAVARAYLGESA